MCLFKKTDLKVHLQAYIDYLKQYKDSLNTAQSTYNSELIHSTNLKALFSNSGNISKSFAIN